MHERIHRLLLRFAALAVVTWTVVQVSAQRTDQRDILFDSNILFESNSGGKEIWAIRPDGSGFRRLTHSPTGTRNQTPRWSPDGRRITFSSTRHAPRAENSDPWIYTDEIYVMNSDVSGLRRLTYGRQQSGSPDWSPDGRQIAFESNRDGHWRIYVMDGNGSNVRRLTTDQRFPSSTGEAGAVWAPDGKRIAFLSGRDSEDFEIYILDLATSNLTRLTDNDAHDSHVAWSPDGQYLSFDSSRDGNSEIYVMRPDGSQVVRLTNHPRMDNAARWSRDGQRLAFNSTRDYNSDDLGNMEIYVMNRDGSGLRRLTNNSTKDTHPDW